MRSIVKPLSIAALAIFVALPAVAQRGYGYESGTFRLRFGEFTPSGEGDYWIDKRIDFTGDEEDFGDDFFAVDYVHPVGPRLGVLLSVGSWESDLAQEYDDFVDPDGFGIFHTTSFELTSLEAGIVWSFTDRGAAISPYLGIGGGYYDWSLTEDGEFIDFTDLSIFSDRFTDSGDTFGWFWVAGLDVPLGESFSIFAESRWTDLDDDLTGDFEGLGTLDLSGNTIAFGVGWRL